MRTTYPFALLVAALYFKHVTSKPIFNNWAIWAHYAANSAGNPVPHPGVTATFLLPIQATPVSATAPAVAPTATAAEIEHSSSADEAEGLDGLAEPGINAHSPKPVAFNALGYETTHTNGAIGATTSSLAFVGIASVFVFLQNI